MKKEHFLKIIKNRRSIRRFKKKKVPFSLLEKLFKAARWAPSACNQQPWLFVAVDKKNLLKRLAQYSTKKILWAPVAVFCFTNNKTKDKNFAHIQSTSAAIENALLYAVKIGLSATWLAGFSTKKRHRKNIKRALNVPENYLLQAVLIIGFADQSPPPPFRKPVSSFLFRNKVSKKLNDFSLKRQWSIKKYKNYLDKIMPVYLTRYIQAREKRLTRFINSLLPKKGIILDCQSFYGAYQKSFPKKGRAVILTNLCFQAAKFLSSEISCRLSLSSSPAKLPFKNKAIDCCTLIETVNYFPSSVIGEVRRVLKPKGKAVLLVKRKFSASYWAYQLNKLLHNHAYLQKTEYIKGRCRYFTSQQLKEKLKGFEIKKSFLKNSQQTKKGIGGKIKIIYKKFFPDFIIFEVEKKDIGQDTLWRVRMMKNNNRWVFEQIKPYLGKDVLEVGSGIGNISQFLVHPKKKLILTDIKEEYLSFLRKRFAANQNVTVFACDIARRSSCKKLLVKNDTVICINVLEHIKNDNQALKNIYKMLKKNGRLVLVVPALKILYGSLDKKLGHFRRYQKKELVKKLKRQNFKIEKVCYHNFVSSFGWFINSRLLNKEIMSVFQVKLVDKFIPYFAKIEKEVKIPFGLSLIVIARKPND